MYVELPFIVVSFSSYQSILDDVMSNDEKSPYNAFLDKYSRIIAAGWQRIDGDKLLFVLHREAYFPLVQHVSSYLSLSGAEMKKEKCYVYLTDGKGDIDCDGYGVVLSKDLLEVVDEQEGVTFRLQHHIPLHMIDFSNEPVLNVGNWFVSFTKGCYVGQEVVARTHHRASPAKKLIVDGSTFSFIKND